MRFRFDLRIMGSRIRPLSMDRGLLCAPTLLTLTWWGKWSGHKAGLSVLSLMDEFYLALCSCGEPVVPKGKSRGKSCRFPSSPPYQLASWTGWGTHAVPRECVAGGCIRGASGEPVGPRHGRCSGMQDFIWAFTRSAASSLQWAIDKRWPD